MSQSKTRCSKRTGRFRIGRVSVYLHHHAWWIYYRENSRPVRRRVADTRQAAEEVAARVNAQLTSATPTLFSFVPIPVRGLIDQYLAHHTSVLSSSPATIARYQTALRHLAEFALQQGASFTAHDVTVATFLAFLRQRQVSPNGHANTPQRPLLDKGIEFILEVCRGLYAYALKQRHLPPYTENPFADLSLLRTRYRNAKRVFVFEEETELQFLQHCRPWEFPVHFTLAKTGLRSGELCHLFVEDLDFERRRLLVRNQPELGWTTKSGQERSVPLVPEHCAVLRRLVGTRRAGVLFLRPLFAGEAAEANRSRLELAEVARRELRAASLATGSSRSGPVQKLMHRLLQRAGAFDPDQIRRSFLRVAQRCGWSDVTCPKSWRHSFATLLQDANVDPLIRQLTLGHQPPGQAGAGLGMTAVYTHTRLATQAREIERALRLWLRSLSLAEQWTASPAV